MAKRSRSKESEKAARTRLDVDERRAQLLQVGTEFFSTNTYEEVSIAEVAKKAGISKGLLYHYFPTKRDFYVAVVRQGAQEYFQALTPPADLPPLERLRMALQAHLEYIERSGRAYAALLSGGVGSDAEIAAIVNRTRHELLQTMLEALGDLRNVPIVRATFLGWMGFVEATSLDWIEHRDLSQSSLRGLWEQLLIRIMELAMKEGLVQDAALGG